MLLGLGVAIVARAAPGQEWEAIEGDRALLVSEQPDGTLALQDLAMHGKGPALRARCQPTDPGACVVVELNAGPNLNDRVFLPVSEARWGDVQAQPGLLLHRGATVGVALTPTCTDGVAGRRLCFDVGAGPACVALTSVERARFVAPVGVRRLTCAEDGRPGG
ncbi:MAG: hypothetical protein R3F59_18995 [Myxococcota bacterium]